MAKYLSSNPVIVTGTMVALILGALVAERTPDRIGSLAIILLPVAWLTICGILGEGIDG